MEIKKGLEGAFPGKLAVEIWNTNGNGSYRLSCKIIARVKGEKRWRLREDACKAASALLRANPSVHGAQFTQREEERFELAFHAR